MKKEEREKNEVCFARQRKGERQALRQGGCEAAVRTGLDVVGPS